MGAACAAGKTDGTVAPGLARWVIRHGCTRQVTSGLARWVIPGIAGMPGLARTSPRGPTHAKASRRTSRPTEPIDKALLCHALRSKFAPSFARASSRSCVQMRWPILYDGACPGHPR